MNLAHELELLQEIAGDLPDYLLSDVLYWQMAGSGDFPKLSLGIALLTRRRLAAVVDQLDAKQRSRLEETERQVDATLEKWRSTAEKKAGQELHSRVTLWQRFWDECRSDPHSCAGGYPHEVTNRVIAQLLLSMFPKLAQLPDALALSAVDSGVRSRLQGDRFIWSPDLQPAFPSSEFRYLYGGL